MTTAEVSQIIKNHQLLMAAAKMLQIISALENFKSLKNKKTLYESKDLELLE